jgi:uncharacterized membrane protein
MIVEMKSVFIIMLADSSYLMHDLLHMGHQQTQTE